jgi:hypothetical protein
LAAYRCFPAAHSHFSQVSSPNRAFGFDHHSCGGQSLCGVVGGSQASAPDSTLSHAPSLPSSWGPAWIKRGPALPESRGTQRKPTTNQTIVSAGQDQLVVGHLRQATEGPGSRAPEGNPAGIVQQRSSSRTDRQTQHALRACTYTEPVSLDPHMQGERAPPLDLAAAIPLSL